MLEGVVDELHFEGDPAIDSTRRRLERVMKVGEPRSEWKWMAGGAQRWPQPQPAR